MQPLPYSVFEALRRPIDKAPILPKDFVSPSSQMGKLTIFKLKKLLLRRQTKQGLHNGTATANDKRQQCLVMFVFTKR